MTRIADEVLPPAATPDQASAAEASKVEPAKQAAAPDRVADVGLGVERARLHLRLPGGQMTLCKKPAASAPEVWQGHHSPHICQRCLTKAKALGLLCQHCAKPLAAPSVEPGLCEGCHTASALALGQR